MAREALSPEEVDGLIEANQRLVQAATRAQDLAEDQQAYYAHVLANVSDAVVATDMHLMVTAWNRGAERLYGWKADEVIGQRQDHFTGSKPPAPLYHRWEQLHQHRDGGRLLVEGTTVPLMDEHNKPRGYLNVVEDHSGRAERTEHRRPPEQALAETAGRIEDVDRLKSEFLSTMTHELRTPLNAILGFTRLVLEKTGPEAPSTEDREYLTTVLTAANHLLELIDDILEVSALGMQASRLQLETFDLAGLLEVAVGRVRKRAENKGLELVVQPGAIVELHTDRGRLLQILVKLMENAVKFTKTGRIEIRYARSDSLVEITVSDTGVGIRPEDRSLLFESFRQVQSSLSRKFEGIGLGLHLSRRLLEMLGGGVQIESTPDQGSAFTIVLPVADA